MGDKKTMEPEGQGGAYPENATACQYLPEMPRIFRKGPVYSKHFSNVTIVVDVKTSGKCRKRAIPNRNYLIVGGYAVAFHGYPRFTKDIDIYYDIIEANVHKLQKALIKFGFSPGDLPEELLLTKGNIIAFGIEPVRVDFINEIEGIEFEGAWKNKVRGRYGKTEANFIGKIDLIKNKSSTERLQDKADVEKLSEK